MKYALCYNPNIDSSKAAMQNLLSILEKYNESVDILDIDNLKKGYDLVFVIGGDGTILKSARFYSEYNTAIFGVNLGRLGFLSQAGGDNLESAVGQILAGDYKIEKRIMLKSGNIVALNDFVVKGEDCSRLGGFLLEINGRFVCEYLADGLIISTPTGSTAYSMAAGGPILTPELDNITIIPICPHTFSARPIVVSSNSKIAISSIKTSNFSVSADGQKSLSVTNKIVVGKSENCANLVLLKDNNFFTVLRTKLNWGTSPANF
ncbi:NAD(+)/NADH kinase [bacterium]|nr:NAD(+)/NADH kinase [bacterium]